MNLNFHAVRLSDYALVISEEFKSVINKIYTKLTLIVVKEGFFFTVKSALTFKLSVK